jgi:heme/copper-type cytochrome/quinol oxidase subunit 3
MAHAPAAPTVKEPAEHAPPAPAATAHHPLLTPGKVAMWLFLATEVMFFTGLIGSYIVLRVGSKPTAYSNFFAPGTDLTRLMDTKGVRLDEAGSDTHQVVEVVRKAMNVTEEEAHHLVEHVPGLVVRGVTAAKAAEVRDQLTALGARAEVEDIKAHKWPLPYDGETNPLSIDLTALNTFILICSSVTMVLALSAVQQGNQPRFKLFLFLTMFIGSIFLSIQVYEYRMLMFVHEYPVGISKTSHFRPDASLFASCFFTMTGFHGAHVTGGVILLACLLIGALMGKFSRDNYSAIELGGLYWHFVDLVWIILFTVVYLI